jgi:hypothetical protein
LIAGDRLCDTPLSAADGRTTSVLALLRDPRHALLLLPGEQDRDAETKLLSVAAEADRAFPDLLSIHVIRQADGPSVATKPAEHVATWLDITGQLYEKLRAAQPGLVLVRPDGYIGCRCGLAEDRALIDHLATYLIRKS